MFDGFAAAPIEQAENRALRILAMNNPSAARHVRRSVENFAAASFDAPRCGFNVADIDVIKPEGKRQRRRLREHAADHLASSRELQIGAHCADMSAGFLPAEERIVKSERL